MTVQGAHVERLLGLLSGHGVEFIVVGGTAAVLHGAPVHTFDLDIVHRRTTGNVERLLNALTAIHAYARARPEQKIAPRAKHLLGEGHLLLTTDLGPLDILCTLEPGQGYDEIMPDTAFVDVGDLAFRVLALPRLIRAKRASGRPKDRAILPVLEATLEETEASSDSKGEGSEDH